MNPVQLREIADSNQAPPPVPYSTIDDLMVAAADAGYYFITYVNNALDFVEFQKIKKYYKRKGFSVSVYLDAGTRTMKIAW